ncbi:MAG: 5-formyltetrahydrofolate cyclo-ligase [Actinobacteria bacterium]|nr:5-formyltetrahydrofolate cyclo-ligase [Actinomycetota bacterium]
MTAAETPATKKQWRRWLRQIARPPSAAVSEQVLRHLGEFLDSRPGPVLTYRPIPGELDLDRLLSRPDSGRFRVTRTNSNGPLTVHSAAAPTELHHYGFAQPTTIAEEVDPATIDIVLVPAVAFGRDGSRLGHGAGYYDRLLPNVGTGAALVGVAYEAIVARTVPVDHHDVPMTHLVTETGMATPRVEVIDNFGR